MFHHKSILIFLLSSCTFSSFHCLTPPATFLQINCFARSVWFRIKLSKALLDPPPTLQCKQITSPSFGYSTPYFNLKSAGAMAIACGMLGMFTAFSIFDWIIICSGDLVSIRARLVLFRRMHDFSSSFVAFILNVLCVRGLWWRGWFMNVFLKSLMWVTHGFRLMIIDSRDTPTSGSRG